MDDQAYLDQVSVSPPPSPKNFSSNGSRDCMPILSHHPPPDQRPFFLMVSVHIYSLSTRCSILITFPQRTFPPMALVNIYRMPSLCSVFILPPQSPFLPMDSVSMYAVAVVCREYMSPGRTCTNHKASPQSPFL